MITRELSTMLLTGYQQPTGGYQQVYEGNASSAVWLLLLNPQICSGNTSCEDRIPMVPIQGMRCFSCFDTYLLMTHRCLYGPYKQSLLITTHWQADHCAVINRLCTGVDKHLPVLCGKHRLSTCLLVCCQHIVFITNRCMSTIYASFPQFGVSMCHWPVAQALSIRPCCHCGLTVPILLTGLVHLLTTNIWKQARINHYCW